MTDALAEAHAIYTDAMRAYNAAVLASRRVRGTRYHEKAQRHERECHAAYWRAKRYYDLVREGVRPERAALIISAGG